MSVLDYGDVIYMHALSPCLSTLDTVYHGALRFKTDFNICTHDCVLCAHVGWCSLPALRLKHWHIFIYKCIIGLLPFYLQTCICRPLRGLWMPCWWIHPYVDALLD